MDTLLAAPIGALLIFLLRIVDVSMGTMRLIIGVRGYRGPAALIGFVEILVWLFAVGAALQHLHSVLHVVGYAAGFAAGNYVGIWLEGKFALGTNVVRAICRDGSEVYAAGEQAAHALRAAGFAVTEIEGTGREHAVDILNVVAQRKQVAEVIDIVREHVPDAFITVEEVRATRGGYFRPARRRLQFMRRR